MKMQNTPVICGIDEAGRGPLAGSVYAASVILGNDFPVYLLNDSKKLSENQRVRLQKIIFERALFWGIGWASHTEIDKLNILQASLLAMKRAFEEMEKKCGFSLGENIAVIVDGIHVPHLHVPCEAMVKADAQISEVMAASILAKTARDSYMIEKAKIYPQYGYEKHKGYPTKAHRQLILKYGPSPIQRISFNVKPV
jgi:ribonuclease HII